MEKRYAGAARHELSDDELSFVNAAGNANPAKGDKDNPSTPIDKEQIYLTYYPKVLQYARSHMANVHEAEALAQNVFLKVYAKLDTFDSEKSALSTWIFNITRNSVIDHYRASASKKHEELTEMIPDGSTGLAENLIMEEQQEMLSDALSQLTGPERDVTLVQISSMMKLSYEQTKRL